MADLKTFNQLNFIGALALYQRRRDCALGLNHVTARQRGLLWYYNVLQRKLYTDAFKFGASIQIQKRMKEIIKEAETATPERVEQLVTEAQGLEKAFDKWQMM